MDALVASDAGHVVNASSINGFWATIGPQVSHTAYAAAKFAVKGFTEALVTDLRLNAPHVKASVVMPGHIGTSIALNSSVILGRGTALEMPEDDVAKMRERLKEMGLPVDNVPDDFIRQAMHDRAVAFRDQAPTTAAQAADIILTDVKAGRWRILVGDDAYKIDELVRADPEAAYEPEFVDRIREAGHLNTFVQATGSVNDAG